MRILMVVGAVLLATSATAQNAPFCVIDNYGTKCFHYDANSCRQDAARSGGMCLPNQSRLAGPTPPTNPFMSGYNTGSSIGAALGALQSQRVARQLELEQRQAEIDYMKAQTAALNSQIQRQNEEKEKARAEEMGADCKAKQETADAYKGTLYAETYQSLADYCWERLFPSK